MKIVSKLPALLCALALGVPAGQAQAELYFGAKGGPMLFSDSAVSADPLNVALVAGYLLGSNVSLEAEYSRSMINGRVRTAGGGQSLRTTTAAGYVAWRSEGALYVKGKAGIAWQDVRLRQSGSDTDTSLSVGAGLGYQLGNGARVELEFTVIESDVGFLSIGLLY